MGQEVIHHHWGIIEHGVRQELFTELVSDEYLWEFTTPEQCLMNALGELVVNEFLEKGGGFELVDIPDPLPRFHKITVWAYHPDPRQLTWISLRLL